MAAAYVCRNSPISPRWLPNTAVAPLESTSSADIAPLVSTMEPSSSEN